MAAALGADVPYFLEGGTVLGLERGDLLFRLADPPPAWVVLVLPAFGVSTKEAFAWFDATAPGDAAAGGERRARQRSRGAGGCAPSRDRPSHFGTAAGRRLAGGDVGQRIGGIRPVSLASGGDRAPPAALPLGRAQQTLVTRTLNHQNYQRLAAT